MWRNATQREKSLDSVFFKVKFVFAVLKGNFCVQQHGKMEWAASIPHCTGGWERSSCDPVGLGHLGQLAGDCHGSVADTHESIRPVRQPWTPPGTACAIPVWLPLTSTAARAASLEFPNSLWGLSDPEVIALESIYDIYDVFHGVSSLIHPSSAEVLVPVSPGEGLESLGLGLVGLTCSCPSPSALRAQISLLLCAQEGQDSWEFSCFGGVLNKRAKCFQWVQNSFLRNRTVNEIWWARIKIKPACDSYKIYIAAPNQALN